MDYHGTLHIYSQSMWHDDAWIAGTSEALAALRDALTAAIESGGGACKSFTGDGEGFSAIVVRVDDGAVPMLRAPYTDDVASDGDAGGTHPSEILGRDRYRELVASDPQ